MKRSIASIGTVMIVALSSTAFGQGTERPTRPNRDERAAVRQPVREPVPSGRSAEQVQQLQKLQQQIEEIRAAHQSLIDELNAIRTTAGKEKAGQTVKQVEALIRKRQAAFQESLRPLEQQLQQLQRAAQTRVGRPDSTGPRTRRAPEFELDSFDGRKIKLADYKGQIVVLEWFNPQCPYSQFHYESAKTMIQTANRYRDKAVVWLAINSTIQTTPQANREFAEKYKLPYPILDDRSGAVARLYGARTTPHVFIIDKGGRIVYDGAIDNAPLGKKEASAGAVNYVDQALAEVTANRPVSLPNTPPYGCAIQYGQP